MTQEDHFVHMVQFRKQVPRLLQGQLSQLSSYLDVEMTDIQVSILNPTEVDFTM
jgi:hypothetical protein